MNRRDFFLYFTGCLVGTTVTTVTRGCYRPKSKFPPEKILEIDEEGVVYELDPGLQMKITEMVRSGDLVEVRGHIA